jgi:hypothetical protein
VVQILAAEVHHHQVKAMLAELELVVQPSIVQAVVAVAQEQLEAQRSELLAVMVETVYLHRSLDLQ